MRRTIKTAIILSLAWVMIVLFIISSASASISYVARGDPVSISEHQPQGTCWYFPSTGSGTLYDQPPLVINNKTFCKLSPDQTRNMVPLTYTLVYEVPLYANGKYFKDVSWINNSLESTFSAVNTIDESGKNAAIVMNDLERTIRENGFNNFTSDQIVIQEPDLKITDFGNLPDVAAIGNAGAEPGQAPAPIIVTAGNNLYEAKGTSNLQDGTPITIKIDEDRYDAQHITSFTYTTKLIRPSTEIDGTWSVQFAMPVNEMPNDWHEITVYGGRLETSNRFKVDTDSWTPGPTPTAYYHYLSNGDIAPVTITIPVPGPTQFIDRWHDATPTPDITDALGGKVDYPYVPGEMVPSWIGIAGLVFMAGIVLVRDFKWRR